MEKEANTAEEKLVMPTPVSVNSQQSQKEESSSSKPAMPPADQRPTAPVSKVPDGNLEINREILARTDREMQHIAEVWSRGNGNADTTKILKAYEFAKKMHAKQFRATGEPYIIHPVAAAKILLDLKVDENTIVAALLHDVVEDTAATQQDITDNFGKEVMVLVDGVTKLSRINYSSTEEMQAQNFRKMFLAMAKDLRVILIKLADRLHNMRTMKFKDHDKQVATARETLDIYAPLAHRLGIYSIKWELEDLSLRYLDPDEYYELVSAVAAKRKDREHYLLEIVTDLQAKVKELNITAEIEGRPKHFYSIYRKMKAQHKTIDEIYDLFATRIIVPTVADCYSVLGMVHQNYRPIPGRFKDYISLPKSNGYQSLHTTVIGSRGMPFEVQIRTREMHESAEYGVAAHWRYKEGIKSNHMSSDEVRLAWMRQFLEFQNDMRVDDADFMNSLKDGLITDEVFAFTPKYRSIALPKGSTPIDFAYHVHSDIGNSMYGAKVNGKMVNLDYELQNADVVEILTNDKGRGPSRDWLAIVKSSTAKNKITAWFKKESRDENIVCGKDLLHKELQHMNLTESQVLKKDLLETVLKKYSMSSVEDLYAAIGYGGLTATRIASRFRDLYLRTLSDEERAKLGYFISSKGQLVYNPDQILTPDKITLEGNETRDTKPAKTFDKKVEVPVEVKGIDNALVRLSKCCNPVPGDKIIGYVTRGYGVAVHRLDCPNIRHILSAFENSPEDAERAARLIDVEWVSAHSRSFIVNIQIIAHDRKNLLADISAAIAAEHASIEAASMNSAQGISARLNISVHIENQHQYERLESRIRQIDSVVNVKRGKN